MEVMNLIFLNVVIVVGLLDLIAPLLLNNFMSLVVEHSFLCNAIHSITVFVGLLFLGYGFSVFVFACRIFVVAVFLEFTIRPHGRTADKGLRYVGALLTIAVGILVH